MRQRNLTALAWGLWILSLSMVTLAVIVTAVYASGTSQWVINAAYALSYAAFGAVGALITTRQPGNRIGWGFTVLGVCAGLALLGASFDGALQRLYAQHGAGAPVGLFFLTPRVVAVTDILGIFAWYATMPTILLLVMTFPTGQFLSRRWRVCVPILVVSAVLMSLHDLVTETRLANNLVANPFAMPGLMPFADIVAAVGGVALLVLVMAMVVSVIVRFVRSRGVERQQLKVFTYGIVVMVLLLVLDQVASQEGSADVLFGLTVLILPVTVAISVLRYRLYDIDIIINRTLVYGSLTALLAGVYVGSVLLLQHVAVAMAGRGAGANPLILVLSTLLIAALFQPLRTRLQRTIDRRFYRQKYDAAKTLARFAETLRSEVELGDLQAHLVGVVEETMRPTHVSVWLRSHNGEATR